MASRRRSRPPGLVGIAAGIGALVLFLLARGAPGATEAVYGQRIFPFVARLLASLSSLVPFGLAEWSFLVVAVAILAAAPRAVWRLRRDGAGFGRAAAGAALALLGAVGGTWCAFVLLWGLNYARPPLGAQFALPEPPAEAQRAALIAAVEKRLDVERIQVPEDADGIARSENDIGTLDRHLRELQAAALADAGLASVPAGLTKRFLISPLLLRWGVSGVYGPFTGEPNIVWPAAPATLPFTIAHERAHLSGFASEDAASFVALLTCWRSERADVRYAGWLALWLEMRRDGRARAPGVQRDVRALAKFVEEHRGREAPAVWKAYSGYLSAHGVKGGTKSYGRVAGLALRWIDKNGLPAIPGAATDD